LQNSDHCLHDSACSIPSSIPLGGVPQKMTRLYSCIAAGAASAISSLSMRSMYCCTSSPSNVLKSWPMPTIETEVFLALISPFCDVSFRLVRQCFTCINRNVCKYIHNFFTCVYTPTKCVCVCACVCVPVDRCVICACACVFVHMCVCMFVNNEIVCARECVCL